MQFDLPTLLMAGSFVAAVSGVFLIFAWLQTEEAHGVLWWATADILLAASVPMMVSLDLAPGSPPVVIGTTLLNISPALIWASARAVNRRHIEIAVVGSGAVAWLVAFAMPSFRESAGAQVGLNLTIVSAFLFAAAYEFWHARSDRLMARWPLVVLLVLHAGSCAVGAFETFFVEGMALTGLAILHSWLGFVHLETLAFVVGTSIFTVAMARERNEMAHKIAAATDGLTGVATRRAFYERGEPMVHAADAKTALAIILFDLDGFKSINDTYGHGPGDEVLKRFGAAALKTLRSSDLIGRLGGEEFGAILSGASVGAAYVAAERIRVAFAHACTEVGDGKIRATVSAGIAAAQTGSTLDSLVQAADLALYRAKLQGRDRVEVGAAPETEPDAPVRAALDRKVA